MSQHPVGATWEGKDPNTGQIYQIWLSEKRDGFEVWRWIKKWSDGSYGPHDSDWGTSYENCRRQMYLDGSNVRLRRIK